MNFIRKLQRQPRPSTCFLCGLFVFIGCSADEQIQSAQLIRVISYDRHGDYPETSVHFPNGNGILGRDSIIAIVFDKPVLTAGINYTVKAQPDGVSPTTNWTLDGDRLEVWDRQIGWNPEKDATLTIIYEDDVGVHKATLDVTLGAYSLDVFPPIIVSGDPQIDEVNVDANRLNHEGIKFTFDIRMDVLRTQIEVYSGQTMLDWNIDCWKNKNTTVILLPANKDDWLLPGQEYEIHLVDFYDFGGTRGKGLENGPIVIRFQTASELNAILVGWVERN